MREMNIMILYYTIFAKRHVDLNNSYLDILRADINTIDNRGYTPIHFAARSSKYWHMFNYFVQK